MEDKKNRFTPDHRIFTICIYAIVTTTICAAIVRCIWNWRETSSTLSSLLSNLSPFLVGFFIAYIMSNLTTSIEKHFFIHTLKLQSNKFTVIFSLVIAYTFVLSLIGASLFFIIPSLIESLTEIANSIQGWYDNLIILLNTINSHLPEGAGESINKLITENSEQYIKLAQDGITKILTNLVPNIATASYSIIKMCFNLFVAVIVSIYMIIDKNRLTKSFYRLIFAVFKPRKAEYIKRIVNEANDIFSGFIIGKTIDSLIIGILCLVILNLFDIGGSYKIIISIFIGITNMIPYFGPIFGAVPCFIIILLSVSPKQSLIFLIIILILQQFDGNILGPYILRDKTGLRPILIIFAITIGGWLGGPIGMFLGVPCVAVLSKIITERIDIKLAENEVLDRFEDDKPEKNKILADTIKDMIIEPVSKIVENVHHEHNSKNH